MATGVTNPNPSNETLLGKLSSDTNPFQGDITKKTKLKDLVSLTERIEATIASELKECEKGSKYTLKDFDLKNIKKNLIEIQGSLDSKIDAADKKGFFSDIGEIFANAFSSSSKPQEGIEKYLISNSKSNIGKKRSNSDLAFRAHGHLNNAITEIESVSRSNVLRFLSKNLDVNPFVTTYLYRLTPIFWFKQNYSEIAQLNELIDKIDDKLELANTDEERDELIQRKMEYALIRGTEAKGPEALFELANKYAKQLGILYNSSEGKKSHEDFHKFFENRNIPELEALKTKTKNNEIKRHLNMILVIWKLAGYKSKDENIVDDLSGDALLRERTLKDVGNNLSKWAKRKAKVFIPMALIEGGLLVGPALLGMAPAAVSSAADMFTGYFGARVLGYIALAAIL